LLDFKITFGFLEPNQLQIISLSQKSDNVDLTIFAL